MEELKGKVIQFILLADFIIGIQLCQWTVKMIWKEKWPERKDTFFLCSSNKPQGHINDRAQILQKGIRV